MRLEEIDEEIRKAESSWRLTIGETKLYYEQLMNMLKEDRENIKKHLTSLN